MEVALQRTLAAEFEALHGKRRPPVGLTIFDHKVTLLVRGSAEQLPAGDYTPTAEIPIIDVLALVLKKAGFQGPNIVAMIREAAIEALNNGEKVKDYVECTKEALRVIKGEMSKLPKKTRDGAFRRAVKMEIVSIEPVRA